MQFKRRNRQNTFISHYVHIKLTKSLEQQVIRGIFISHYVHIKRKIYVIIAGWLKELYIPLRSYKTAKSPKRSRSIFRLYIPLRSYKTVEPSRFPSRILLLYIPLRSYKTEFVAKKRVERQSFISHYVHIKLLFFIFSNWELLPLYPTTFI